MALNRSVLILYCCKNILMSFVNFWIKTLTLTLILRCCVCMCYNICISLGRRGSEEVHVWRLLLREIQGEGRPLLGPQERHHEHIGKGELTPVRRYHISEVSSHQWGELTPVRWAHIGEVSLQQWGELTPVRWALAMVRWALTSEVSSHREEFRECATETDRSLM